LPLSYTNTTGSPAHIEAWIDWNNNGEFDAGENLGLRIRISNQDNMTPYGLVDEGEVEDYLIGIECATQICIPVQTTVIRN